MVDLLNRLCIMEKLISLILKRRLSTARIDAMPDGMARAALDRRYSALVEELARKPLPPPRSFAPLGNPLEKTP
jgi:hypothetical protein